MRRLVVSFVSFVFLFCLLVCLLGSLPALAKSKPKDILLPEGFLPITDAEKGYTKVPYAEAAPAVVLLQARQDEWFLAGDEYALRAQDFRRVKILTSAGIEKFGDYSVDLYGDWRVKKIDARTVLPDGTELDASKNIFQEKSDSGYQTIRVAFPKVQVGAILDFHLTVAADYAWSVEPWIIQESIPVLHNRFVMIPPKGLKYRVASMKLPPERSKAEKVSVLQRILYVWDLENIEALAEEANSPPTRDISQTLFVIPEEYRDENVYVPIAKDWKSFMGNGNNSWQEWTKKKNSQAAALAKQVTQGKTTSIEKAEAIRRTLKERVRLDYLSRWVNCDSPDEVLTKGAGSSGAIAGTAAAMLRAVGVDAQIAAIRRRSQGMIPVEFPLPALLDDVLVRIPTEGGAIFFSPVADMPVGLLPWDCTDLYAVPYDGKSEAPVKIPDFKSADNKTVRDTEASVGSDGKLTGQSVEWYTGVSAELWRRRLRGEDVETRKAMVRDHLRTQMPGAQVMSFEIVNLDDDSKALQVKARWETEGYATSAGKRLLVNPNLFSRESAAEWAPTQRRYEIDLGSNYETVENVFLNLPEGAGEVMLPPSASMVAGPVGLYESSYEKRGGRVIARRHMRLEVHRFPVESYPGLKKWFTSIAAADEKPIVLSLN